MRPALARRNVKIHSALARCSRAVRARKSGDSNMENKKPVIAVSMMMINKECAVPSTYLDFVHRAGGIPYPVPCIADDNMLNHFAATADGMVFIGGKDYAPSLYHEPCSEETDVMDKRRQNTDMKLIRIVLEKEIPVLGICGGCQLINIALGGKLIQHIANAARHKNGRHQIFVKGDGWLKRIVGKNKITVNSIHHQAINPDFPGTGLKVVAEATDGTVEAIELCSERFLLGVQWHPEMMTYSRTSREIFTSLIQAAKKYGKRNRT